MPRRTITAPKRVRGDITVPGDKSISHRALILAALADGKSRISHRAPGEDQDSMLRCLAALGVPVQAGGDDAELMGLGLRGLKSPAGDLDCGNSGNTMRFLMGALAGTPGMSARLVGDSSLSRRPMARVAEPLAQLGAAIRVAEGGTPPVEVDGQRLRGGAVTIEVPSAQVKTAVLLAGLQADGVTAVTERALTRDHTERLLRRLGVDLRVGQAITLQPPRRVVGFELTVPGDPSSAAFWAVLAASHPDADLSIRGVCLNPTRTGFLDVLTRMGADIRVENQRQEGGEMVGDLQVGSGTLHGVVVDGWEIPSMVDEIPVLALAAAAADGDSRFDGLGELRHKEVDRLAAIERELSAMGAAVSIREDSLVFEGRSRLRGGAVASGGDHRMAMMLAIAGSIAAGETSIDDADAASVSYPGFYDQLAAISE
jgi:3-phosphoshikimate 1-carboxyvinyltransferase